MGTSWDPYKILFGGSNQPSRSSGRASTPPPQKKGFLEGLLGALSSVEQDLGIGSGKKPKASQSGNPAKPRGPTLLQTLNQIAGGDKADKSGDKPAKVTSSGGRHRASPARPARNQQPRPSRRGTGWGETLAGAAKGLGSLFLPPQSGAMDPTIIRDDDAEWLGVPDLLPRRKSDQPRISRQDRKAARRAKQDAKVDRIRQGGLSLIKNNPNYVPPRQNIAKPLKVQDPRKR